MKGEKILFVIPWLPYPFKSGGHQALFNGIAAVSDNYDIYITYTATDNAEYCRDEKEFLKKIPRAHLFPLLIKKNNLQIFFSKVKRLIKKIVCIKEEIPDKEECISIRWIKSILPLQKMWLDHISTICDEYHFDIIQVEMPLLISQILTLPCDCKRIYVHHELGFVCRSLEMQMIHNTSHIQACKSFADMVEVDLLNMYDAILTLSSIDKRKLLTQGVSTPIFTSFSTIEMSKIKASIIGNGKHLTFIGADYHIPNLLGIKWFLVNCWSKLRNIDEGYRLSIIGEWSSDNIKDIQSKYKNIEFQGFVDDLETAIKGTIMIVPITIGSGIRMKILEACSIGVPFVSTSIGAEGIPVNDGENCFIADTPNSFLEKIQKLRDVTIQQKFVDNAYEMVQTKYSRKALTENRLEIYKAIKHGQKNHSH